MNRYKQILVILLLLVIPFISAVAYDMNNVIAWPVPFNPQKTTLKIGEISPVAGYIIRVEIFDINGDLVCKKSGTTTQLVWNGRNKNGRMVKPGLYIIKVTIENSTGDYGKKVIRILVDY